MPIVRRRGRHWGGGVEREQRESKFGAMQSDKSQIVMQKATMQALQFLAPLEKYFLPTYLALPVGPSLRRQ